MKKLFMLFLLLFPLFVLAQNTTPVLGDNFAQNFATIAGMAALTMVITGWIKTALLIIDKWARWLSWLVAIVLSILGWLLNLGLFEPLEFWKTCLYGLGIGLVANGIFSSETVQWLLTLIKAQKS